MVMAQAGFFHMPDIILRIYCGITVAKQLESRKEKQRLFRLQQWLEKDEVLVLSSSQLSNELTGKLWDTLACFLHSEMG